MLYILIIYVTKDNVVHFDNLCNCNDKMKNNNGTCQPWWTYMFSKGFLGSDMVKVDGLYSEHKFLRHSLGGISICIS